MMDEVGGVVVDDGEDGRMRELREGGRVEEVAT